MQRTTELYLITWAWRYRRSASSPLFRSRCIFLHPLWITLHFLINSCTRFHSELRENQTETFQLRWSPTVHPWDCPTAASTWTPISQRWLGKFRTDRKSINLHKPTGNSPKCNFPFVLVAGNSYKTSDGRLCFHRRAAFYFFHKRAKKIQMWINFATNSVSVQEKQKHSLWMLDETIGLYFNTGTTAERERWKFISLLRQFKTDADK